jgi:hypothetical protein
MLHQKIFSLIVFMILLFSMSSCDLTGGLGGSIERSTDKAVAALDKAIYRLETQSVNVQQTLRDLEGELIREAQTTIANEVSSTLNRTTAEVGVEFRCEADFVRDRVIEDLKRIKAKLLRQSVPPLKPVVCRTDPIGAIDMGMVKEGRQPNLIFFGYNFDADNTVKVSITRGGQEIDVPQAFVNVPTHYHMSLNLNNMLGAGLLSSLDNNQFVLKWQGHTEYTVGINQAICKTYTDRIVPNPEPFIPDRTRGDGEYDGNGPKVWAGVRLVNRGDRIDAMIAMKAEETQDDWTTCSGTTIRTIYQPRRAGYRIGSILSSTESPYTFRYVDHNHEWDKLVGDGPVREYQFLGDTDYDDDCPNHTKVIVYFNELVVELVEAQECVSR